MVGIKDLTSRLISVPQAAKISGLTRTIRPVWLHSTMRQVAKNGPRTRRFKLTRPRLPPTGNGSATCKLRLMGTMPT